ncbi:hypothetical protein BKA64DRAFT_212606 [Cadophora sp. MPI-SDFR-AT-0126]|nr:hypothetical protein BKA64DRAFT_212606 [Leotiomycetes sp. MPI-SDFR-AT-0126]
MAVVVRESSTAGNGKTGSPLWTATGRTNTHLMSNLKGAVGKSYWTWDYLKFAQAAAIDQEHSRQHVLGVECPKPLGIITFEDVIDTILQKTSRDERDFFDRDCSYPPTKSKKSGDFSLNSTAHKTDKILPRSPKRAHVTFEKSVNPGTIRKRKVSNKVSAPGGLDGADDRSIDGYCASSIRLPKNRSKSIGSSYTQNSEGGFHGADESGNAMDHAILMTPEEIVGLANTSSSDCPGNPYSHVKTASLPTRRSDTNVSEEKVLRNVSAGPRLPQLRRVAPFSRDRDNASGFEGEAEDQEGDDLTELSMPNAMMAPGQFPLVDMQLRYNPNISGIDIEEMEDTLEPTKLEVHARETSGETASLMSWSSDDDAQQMTRVYDALPVLAGANPELSLVKKNLDAIMEEKKETKPYDGFPPELLDSTDKDNRLPEYLSKTLPRSIGTELNLEELAEKVNDVTPPIREGSFHDDRALLPSQRRLLEHSSLGLGARSSSLWF